MAGTAQAGDLAAPEASFSHLLKLDFAAMTALSQEAEPQDALEAEPAAKPAFGTKNSWRWYLQGGFAVEPAQTENTFVELGGGVSYFLDDNLSLELEVNGMYFNQIGDDALAFNFNLLGRWHFLARDRWSIYGDVGAGFLVATAEVPGPTPQDLVGGAKFEFTPQGGLGFTYEIKPQMRFLAGARWYHISNAQTNESNRSRDSLLIYLGVSMPF